MLVDRVLIAAINHLPALCADLEGSLLQRTSVPNQNDARIVWLDDGFSENCLAREKERCWLYETFVWPATSMESIESIERLEMFTTKFTVFRRFRSKNSPTWFDCDFAFQLLKIQCNDFDLEPFY